MSGVSLPVPNSSSSCKLCQLVSIALHLLPQLRLRTLFCALAPAPSLPRFCCSSSSSTLLVLATARSALEQSSAYSGTVSACGATLLFLASALCITRVRRRRCASGIPSELRGALSLCPSEVNELELVTGDSLYKEPIMELNIDLLVLLISTAADKPSSV